MTQKTIDLSGLADRLSEMSKEDGDKALAFLSKQGVSQPDLGNALGVSRYVIARRIKHAGGEVIDPFAVEKPKKARAARAAALPSPETMARLIELQPEASKVRGKGDRGRAEAEEFMALIFKATTKEGATLYAIAKELGVTHGALHTRLARYGYTDGRNINGKSKSYRPLTARRVVVQ